MNIGEAKIRQEAAFWAGEGDAWFRRNRDSAVDPAVIGAFLGIMNRPQKILEIGCGTGKYLDALRGQYGCSCVGVDPSGEAIAFGREHYPALKLYLGTAETAYKMFRGEEFDILIFGFCLYVLGREDLFCTVAFADALIKEGGYLAIHDFDPVYAHAVPYHHKEGLFSYKMNYPKLWLANPAYQLVSKSLTRPGEALTIIKKGAWPEWQKAT